MRLTLFLSLSSTVVCSTPFQNLSTTFAPPPIKCGCQVPLNIPVWTSKAIAAFIAVLGILIVAVLYFYDQIEKTKNYYGKTDTMTEEELAAEREERDAIAFGATKDVYFLERDESHTGGVKWRVLQRRKRLHLITPVGTVNAANSVVNSAGLGVHGSGPKSSLNKPESPVIAVQVVVIRDATSRAPELVEIITATEIPENVKHDRRLKAEFLLETICLRLEKMLEQTVIVQGYLPDVGWLIKGGDITLDANDDYSLLIKILIKSPVEMVVLCYNVVRQVIPPPSAPKVGGHGSSEESKKVRVLLPSAGLVPSAPAVVPPLLPQPSSVAELKITDDEPSKGVSKTHRHTLTAGRKTKETIERIKSRGKQLQTKSVQPAKDVTEKSQPGPKTIDSKETLFPSKLLVTTPGSRKGSSGELVQKKLDPGLQATNKTSTVSSGIRSVHQVVTPVISGKDLKALPGLSTNAGPTPQRHVATPSAVPSISREVAANKQQPTTSSSTAEAQRKQVKGVKSPKYKKSQ